MIELNFTNESEWMGFFALTVASICFFGVIGIIYYLIQGRRTLQFKGWLLFFLLGCTQILFLWTDEQFFFRLYWGLEISFFAALILVGLLGIRSNSLYFIPGIFAVGYWIIALIMIDNRELEDIPLMIAFLYLIILGVLGIMAFIILLNRHKTPSAYIQLIGLIIFLLSEFLLLFSYVAEESMNIPAGLTKIAAIVCFLSVVMGLHEDSIWKGEEIDYFD